MADSPTPAPRVHSSADRAKAYDRFNLIIQDLLEQGWTRYRVDTLVHPSGDERDRDRWTIRHQYTAGTWELHLEPDRTWHPGQRPTNTVRLTAGQELPSVEQAQRQLFAGLYRFFTEWTPLTPNGRHP